MDLNTLECFIAVCEHKQINRAAEKLFISPSAISRKISALEQEVGHELLIRTKPFLAITAQGRIMLDYAREAVALHSAMTARLNATSEARPQVIRLGFQNLHQSRWISELTTVLKERFPHIQIRVERGSLPVLNEKFNSGELDAIFDLRYTDQLPEDACYKAFPLTLYAAMNAAHPLAQRKGVYIHELKDERFVMLREEAAPMIFKRITENCLQNGFSITSAICYNASEDVTAAVAAGEGITLTDNSARIFEGANIVFIPIIGHKPLTQWLLLWNPDSTNPAMTSLKEAVSIMTC